MAHATGDYGSYSNHFDDITYYGRTNILKFKLCHKYCEKCYEFGSTDDNQTCVSCLPSYTYMVICMMLKKID